MVTNGSDSTMQFIRNKALEEAAALCDAEAKTPSTLWQEPGCWKHAASNCAVAIRAMMRKRVDG